MHLQQLEFFVPWAFMRGRGWRHWLLDVVWYCLLGAISRPTTIPSITCQPPSHGVSALGGGARVLSSSWMAAHGGNRAMVRFCLIIMRITHLAMTANRAHFSSYH